ncbi:MAG: hypothetical protein HRU23_19810 [Gammaproteobacteria bacterium]|nr:hypothetical protein [Gammaproteobacteria bacterium]
MFAQFAQKYKRLPGKERSQIVVLVVCVVLSAYGFGAAMLWQNMFEAQKLANRKENRINTRIGKIEEPKFDGSVSQVKLNTLQQQLANSQLELNLLTKKFIALDDATSLQQLKLSISELADNVELEIKHFEVLGIEHKTSEEELEEFNDSRSQYYKRPYLSIKAESQFYSLLNFLQALKQLEHVAVVQDMKIELHSQGNLVITMKILV